MLSGRVMAAVPCEPGTHVNLTEATETVPLGTQAYFLEDKTAALTLADVMSGTFSQDFVRGEKETPAFGFSKSAIWVRVCLEDASGSRDPWYLEVAYPALTHVDLHVVRADGSVTTVKSGANVPVAERGLPYRYPLFRLDVAQQRIVAVYLRVSSEGSLTLPVTLWKAEAFSFVSMTGTAGFAVYFGVMVAMISYNLFLWWSIRDSSYLYYVLFIASFAGFLATLHGFTANYVFPEASAGLYKIIPVSIGLVILFSTIFARHFLVEGSVQGWVRKLLLLMSCVGAFCAMVGLVAPYAVAVRLSTVMTPVNAVALLVAGVMGVRAGYKPARYFLAAWIILLLAVFMYPLKAFGVIPSNAVTSNGMQFGSAIEVLLLSLALAARIRDMKDEKEAAQRTMIENMARMDKLKDEFLANTSHELRTPLNGMIGMAEAMLHNRVQPPTPQAISQLHTIVTSGRRLSTLINDILDFSKLRHEELVLGIKSVDLRAVVDIVFTLSGPAAAVRRNTLINQVDEHCRWVLADEGRLQQILHNLVGNAVKFTESGTVSVQTVIRGQRVHVRVVDTGIGIPPDRLESIFESFNQGDGSISREYGGTGIGLSITRKLIELHGGRVIVESSPGKGSVFDFSLPLDTVTAGAIADTPVATEESNAVQPGGDLAPSAGSVGVVPGLRQASGPRVLVVDDELVNRQVLVSQLASEGFRVSEAANGFEALEVIQQEPPDIVLLDVMMPRLPGYDTCRRLREIHPASVMPVIFLTARSQIQDIVAGFEAGGNDYLTKPFSRDELLARVNVHAALVTTHKVISAYSKNLEQRVAERTRELLDTQQQLVLKEKLAALGTLTAGVAHEINNPNNFVSVGVQNLYSKISDFEGFVVGLLSDEADPELSVEFRRKFDSLNKQLSIIREGSERIGSIVKGLRVVTHLDEGGRIEVDVVDGLNQTLEMLQGSLFAAVQVHRQYAGPVRLLCWAAELNQVFVSILTNAAEALKTRQDTEGKPMLSVSAEVISGRVLIRIVDSGDGVDQAIADRIFDPFFTTKGVGHSGLGLSTSREIIRRHGGDLLHVSQPQGTCFEIQLPLMTDVSGAGGIVG